MPRPIILCSQSFADLSLEELRAIVEQALSSVERAGRDLYLVAPH